MRFVKRIFLITILFLLNANLKCEAQSDFKKKIDDFYKEIPKYIQQKLNGFVEKEDTATVNKLISIAYLYDNYKPDSAVIYALKSLAISKKINYEYGITYSYQVLVNKNRDNGDLPAALNYANTQFRYVQEIKDTSSMIFSIEEISKLWFSTKNYRYAIEASLKGLELIKKIKDWGKKAGLDENIDKREIQTFSQILGLSYNSLSMKDSALFYFNRALEAVSGLNSDYNWDKADVNLDMAKYFYQNKDYELAIGYLNKNLLLDEDEVFNEDRNHMFLKTFIAIQKADSALKYFKLLPTYIHSTNKSLLNDEIDKVGTTINYYKLINNKDSILKYQNIFLELKDSAYNQEELKRLESINISETVKDFELQQKLKQEEKERSNNIKLGAISIFIPTFTALVFYLGRRKTKNTKIFTLLGLASLLMLFEFISLLIHPYVEHLTNHDAILMYLILLIIASILVPIHHKLESWVKEKI
jgi:hypothetical protein